MIHRKGKILISTKINNRTKQNLNWRFFNSPYREMNSNESNCQNEKKIKQSNKNVNKL